MYASRHSKFSKKKSIGIATFLCALGFIINAKFQIPLFLNFYLLLGLSTAWLGLFFLRGWWSVVISIPAACASIPLFGHPVAAFLFVMQVFVVTWVYRNKMVDDAIEKGHVLFFVILYALFILGPLYFLGLHYLVEIPYEACRLVAYKAILNSTLCVLIAYFIYVVSKLILGGRNQYSPGGISVSGVVFLSSYGLITIVMVFMTMTFFGFYKSDAVESYHSSLVSQSNSVWLQYRNSLSTEIEFSDIQQLLDDQVFVKVQVDGSDVFSSNRDMFRALDSDYTAPKTANLHVSGYPKLKLLYPSSTKALLNKEADSFYSFTTEFKSSGDYPSGVVSLVQDSDSAVFDDVKEFAYDVFRFLAFGLSGASFYSFLISYRAEKEINTLFYASKPPSTKESFNAADGDINTSEDTKPFLRYSPIREISRGVDLINRSFAEIRDSRDSIRRLNAIAQKQLSNAGTIQQSFLVKSSPKLDSVDLSLFMKPAYNAGGDWYDAFSVGDKLFLVIADVCDKGVPAALFMSVFRSLIRYDAISRKSWDLDESGVNQQMVNVITHVNDYMSINHGDDVMFATIFFVVFDQSTGVMHYISAGHESPLIINPSLECLQLETTGPAVGIFKDSTYVANSIVLHKGSHFVAFTDGVIDARNDADESFGTDYLIQLCKRLLSATPDMSSKQLMSDIKGELISHIGDASQFDDITLATFLYR